MRILHAIHSLSGGGAERQLQLLCAAGTGPGTAHAIFCVNPAGNALAPEAARLYVAASSRPLSLAYWRSLRAAITDFAPDIVHAWLPASVTIPALALGAAAGRRRVFSYRSRMRFHRPLSYPEFAAALLFANRIVSNNPIVDSHPAFRRLFSTRDGVVIRNAVAIPGGVRRSGPFPRDGRCWRLACVGRLTAAKNLVALVAALGRLPPGPDWRLDVYGDGELRADVEAAVAAHRLGDRITLHGFRGDVYARMAEADLLLMPSLWEGMPNVALEALAIGVPLAISGISAHRELLPGDGTVAWLDPADPGAMAEVIAGCISGGTDLAAMAARGIDFAAGFGPKRMAAEYRAFYESVLAGR